MVQQHQQLMSRTTGIAAKGGQSCEYYLKNSARSAMSWHNLHMARAKELIDILESITDKVA